ncbi:hypothetical protein ACHHYP_08699 [Achlya hypogyna]|uniref:Calcineurin-like phosphoesterase domain-containing protein n=1 Tax=Achlya hypogyna TaxID=1202772 RepID=A0A1V9YP26_ACHHY|nr:hypothetical protein ACHHYP_08699 [Achlya hypogyna]
MDTLHVLVVADIRNAIARVNDLCDYVIRHHPVDVVLVCGSFVAPAAPQAAEMAAAAEGDMTALISRLEMIVCRVIYVPGPADPASVKQPTTKPFLPKLTPYSINCDGSTAVLLPEDDTACRSSEASASALSELIIEGFASENQVAMEIRTKYVLDDSQCTVYRKLARLPWCARICLSPDPAGSIEWIEKGQVVLRPGWFEHGNFALLEFGPRATDDDDVEASWDVKACEVLNLDDKFLG